MIHFWFLPVDDLPFSLTGHAPRSILTFTGTFAGWALLHFPLRHVYSDGSRYVTVLRELDAKSKCVEVELPTAK